MMRWRVFSVGRFVEIGDEQCAEQADLVSRVHCVRITVV